MIEVVLDERCTRCNLCVEMCPTNVFDGIRGELPVIARQSDCQTCFMCELYCPADALYVHPDCATAVAVDPTEIIEAELIGQYRRDSGWGKYRGQIENEIWRMDSVITMTRVASGGPVRTPGR
jgi:NAD-dependent dihydropyrimidine dehydrogenase PreA subunit